MKFCPLLEKEGCDTECLGFCKITRSKMFKKHIKIKKCPVCDNILVPLNDTFVHIIEDKTCKYSQVQSIEIRNTEKFYDEDIGTPEYTLEELFEQLTSKPRNVFIRAWFKIREVFRK